MNRSTLCSRHAGLACFLLIVGVAVSCDPPGTDVETGSGAPSEAPQPAGGPGEAAPGEEAAAPEEPAPEEPAATAPEATAQGTDGPSPLTANPEQLARGDYLVNVLMGCNDCHTPMTPQGPDMTRYLAGVDCWVDLAPPADNGEGCLTVPNLTQDATGIANRSDDQLRDALVHGLRPDGTALIPFMPYEFYAHMTAEDIDAVIAFLRTVPPVEHRVARSEPPFEAPPAPLPPAPLDQIPSPDPSSPDFESAMRGRYLAVNTGACVSCHTNTVEPMSPVHDWSAAFAGGRSFPTAWLGMPSPPWPEVITTPNLTNHETGLANWSRDDIIRAIREGVEPSGGHICPPMGSGPMGPFARLSEQDLGDIVAYLQSLPGVDNAVADCEPPAGPPPGH